MFEKDLGLMPLFDIYGKLLSDHQQKMFELYYGDDLSLSEISEEMNISRQGVRDAIKRCEEALVNFEQKLGFYEKTKALDKCINELRLIDEKSGIGLEDIIDKLSKLL